MVRPTKCESAHLVFLDNLRESGETNMYGGAMYLQDEYPSLTKKEARAILTYWMTTFGQVDR